MSTKIEWCDETWNPITGCSPISKGCQNCYAEKFAYRLKRMGIPKYQDVVNQNGWTGKIGFDFSVFDRLPKAPKRVFVGSMGDLWHPSVDWPMIDQVFEACLKAPWHTYIFLTKRIEAVWYYFKSPVYPEHKDGRSRWEYLTHNIVFMTSVENQEMADKRVPILLQIPAKVKGVSCEPLLSDIDLTPWLNSDMVHKNHKGEDDHEKKRKGVFGSSCNGLVQSGFRRRNNFKNGSINRGEQNGKQAIYEDVESPEKSRAFDFEKSSEGDVHSGFKKKDASLCASDCLDDRKSSGNCGRFRNQPQRRESEEQQAREFGGSHQTTKHASCWQGSKGFGETKTKRRGQSFGKVDRTGRYHNKGSLPNKIDASKQNCRDVQCKTGNNQRNPSSKKLDPYLGISWIVAGPETGPGARPCDPEWIENLYEQCKSAGVPFFDKRPNYLAREFPA